jgi:putative acetyltransferase
VIEFVEARFPRDRDAVVGLFRAYAASLSTNLCFQGFDAELAGLPGDYAPPDGRLFLVREGDVFLGCGALRRLDATTCEMKRVYLDPPARGRGAGRGLVQKILGAARDVGYHKVWLDTLPELVEARALYRKLGFQDIAPYNDNPVPGVLYFGFDLRASRVEST